MSSPCVDISIGTKRKRTKNTSREQMEIYLQAMENDYVLRSNTINPTLGPTYLQDKWDQLALELNSAGDGPILTVDEWKKRFTDWKYSLQAKKRKIESHRTKTGGGPMMKTILSEIEERALDVWGRVTVEGADVTRYEGINVNNDQVQPILIEVLNEETVTLDEQEKEKVEERKKNTVIKKTKEKPLSLLAEKLVTVTDENTKSQKDLVEAIQNFSKEYCDLQRKKLEFKIKSFQYLHPDFKM
ncbi:myb/SANT-like DNA-binding domain-containing protein 4 [Coccinella septempunctata]|uniref:myb/SANT-like DNA-binding domain-containing protein 4 n=1 Tax=Coccinella septempunctata TaxID=41139 RepID=UPI001D07E976|nr:myb/SANT-like DNA-binding domain-containing protein 4 [Coccinella septempunctata]